jgi:hypothetical protein
VHILDASITVRGIVNVSAIAVAEAADRNKPQPRG